MNKKIKIVLGLAISLVIIMFSNSYATSTYYSDEATYTDDSSTYNSNTNSQKAKVNTPVVDATKKIYDY